MDNFKKEFNCAPPSVMHIDINSCFATIEQQHNPKWRNKPLAVAARDTPHACIVASSIQAKKLGIKTGNSVFEAKKICPNIIVVTPDPPKYRKVHSQMHKILLDYTQKAVPKSIDEFALHLHNIAREIKGRIRDEIGEVITVSIGIGPNRFLAKTAAGLEKPDGLQKINSKNFLDIYTRLTLPDLNGINFKNTLRLNNANIFSVIDFYNASYEQLKSAFQSISAYYWYLRLRGWEIDDFETKRGTYSQSYVLPKPTSTLAEITVILQKHVPDAIAFGK